MKKNSEHSNIFRPQLVHTFHVFSADVNKLFAMFSKKLTAKYSQTVVGWYKGSEFIYSQFFVVIGMVDLTKKFEIKNESLREVSLS